MDVRLPAAVFHLVCVRVAVRQFIVNNDTLSGRFVSLLQETKADAAAADPQQHEIKSSWILIGKD